MSLAPTQHGYGTPTAADVTAALRRGARLCLCFRNGRPQWQLSTGVSVPDGIAKAVVARPDIVGSDAGLFDDAPAQSYWWRP